MNKMKFLLVFSFFLLNSLFCLSQITKYQYEKIGNALNEISSFYTDSIDNDKIIEDAIKGVLIKLDPHSKYYSADKVGEINRTLDSSFEGVGITYNLLHDTILVLSTYKEGPSAKAGIKAGDRIVAVDSQKMAGVKIKEQQIRDALLGKKGSKVEIAVKRKGEISPLVFEVTRNKIPLHSISAVYMASRATGYIKLDKFSVSSGIEFKQATKELKEKGALNLIIDLRGNGGGYLRTAVGLADNFLGRGKLIVYTKGLKSPKKEYSASRGQIFKQGRLVILIDEGSASASEILSGAMQDWDRAVIVGRRSYGKGLVQRPFFLNDGSMIRLTIARYYTPSGRCIQKSYAKGNETYQADIETRLKHGELTNADSISFIDSLKYTTLTKNRTVYGGGGVMPDVFVPLDTSRFPSIYRKLNGKGIINSFIHQYVDDNRQYLNTVYSSFPKYEKTFEINDKISRLFLDYIRKEGTKEEILETRKQLNMSDMRKNKYIQNHFKSLIASDLWDLNEYYYIANKKSEIYLEGLKITQDQALYEKYLK